MKIVSVHEFIWVRTMHPLRKKMIRNVRAETSGKDRVWEGVCLRVL